MQSRIKVQTSLFSRSGARLLNTIPNHLSQRSGYLATDELSLRHSLQDAFTKIPWIWANPKSLPYAFGRQLTSRWLFYYFAVLHCADKSQPAQNSCPRLPHSVDSRFGLYRVVVVLSFLCSISPALSCLCLAD